MIQTPRRDYVEVVLAFLGAHAAQLGHCRWAMVAPDPSVYGMAKVAEAPAHRTTIDFGTFRDEASALEWLAGGTSEVRAT